MPSAITGGSELDWAGCSLMVEAATPGHAA